MTPSLIDIDGFALKSQDAALDALRSLAALSETTRARITRDAAKLVRRLRTESKPGLMEVFLAEYGLSTDEGVALMCLAEALLRVPDAETMDALIEDKISPSNWGQHLGRSASSLVNASTWALLLTGRVLDDDRPGLSGILRGAVKRLGEPVIRRAVARAMKEMGRQFVLGEDINAAMTRASGMEAKGYTYSYDMLGEAAMTAADAQEYFRAYSGAIASIAANAHHETVAENPGISIKLSALHPRYEMSQRDRVLRELPPRVLSLAIAAAEAGIGFNIDAEEADRLTLSLEVIEAVLASPSLPQWDGFGVVVQAYGPRAPLVIDWLTDAAQRHSRRIMVRLVKGAYWDSEIKRAQIEGLTDFPVFTAKAATDISYAANARKLLGRTQWLYPQFATHNAQTAATVLAIAQEEGVTRESFEFQRLHGMGEALHDLILADHGTRCRIYAPVGAHKDLLAYLVRRLLENGANSSFVNQIVDPEVPAEVVAADPFASPLPDAAIPKGPTLFAPERVNSKGWDLTDRPTLMALEEVRATLRAKTWDAGPILHLPGSQTTGSMAITNPAAPDDIVGTVTPATPQDAAMAIQGAQPWPARDRGKVLARAADLYEANAEELFAILAREAGKTPLDAVGELREAVDFLRFYGAQATTNDPLGTILAISPWNFPLAIFTGQIAAALTTGNAVLAKPAEQTPLIAAKAVELLHKAGVPNTALQLLPGGGDIGAALIAPGVDGVVFTGSTATAKRIQVNMAKALPPGAPLIAETGGLNAMIVDSTALPEHAVRDIVASAFQSAGQRCSALRCLYVQEDIAEDLKTMLVGAMDELTCGDPWDFATDVGPVIDEAAQRRISDHIEAARSDGRLLHQGATPPGFGIPPTLIEINGIANLTEEIFGPVLHIATFASDQLTHVTDDINATGYGLTFGLHTRIDDRVQDISERIRAGNIYINRNQIGAVVGSQPFGGEGLSGTGPKAGGPHYLARFQRLRRTSSDTWGHEADLQALNAALAEQSEPNTQIIDQPGPTGESNRLHLSARPPLLCLGPGPTAAKAQADAVRAMGGTAVMVDGALDPNTLRSLTGFSGVLYWADDETARAYAIALADRDGPILPLITADPDPAHVLHERHISIDTTAAGGNTTLLAQSEAPSAA